MIRLNLSNRPEWLDLLPGLRVLVAPLTTALMVSARADPAIDTLSEASSQEDMALAMAKAVARRAVLETQFLYCVDAETECLTLGGWKRRDELVDGDVVIGVDDSGQPVSMR